jgi:hypothetical protein
MDAMEFYACAQANFALPGQFQPSRKYGVSGSPVIWMTALCVKTLPIATPFLECAPDGGPFQAADLTGLWAWRSSYRAGFR